MKITHEFLKQNNFSTVKLTNKGYIASRVHGESLVFFIDNDDKETNIYLNGVLIPGADAIRLNQLWILATGRKENWFNYLLPCGLCGDIPEKMAGNNRTIDNTSMDQFVVRCVNCNTKITGLTDKSVLLSWNLNRLGFFTESQ